MTTRSTRRRPPRTGVAPAVVRGPVEARAARRRRHATLAFIAVAVAGAAVAHSVPALSRALADWATTPALGTAAADGSVFDATGQGPEASARPWAAPLFLILLGAGSFAVYWWASWARNIESWARAVIVGTTVCVILLVTVRLVVGT